MELKRFYGQKEGNFITLTGREYIHCVKVTRHKVGYLIIGCTGDGNDYRAVITSIDGGEVIAEIQSAEPNLTEPAHDIILLQACCKEFDFIAQKAVELGATRIIPYISERTNSKPLSADRLESIVLDAAKQCGRAKLPEIEAVAVGLEAALAAADNARSKVICYECERNVKMSDVVKPSGSVAVVIGPEGGFTPEEVKTAESLGYTAVTLGRRILRAETASVVALTLACGGIGEL